MTPQSKITWDDLTPESPDMGTLIQSEAGKFGLRSSSYGRTPQHNAEVGGAVHSRHLSNQALDLDGDENHKWKHRTPEQRQQVISHYRNLYGDQIHELMDEGDHLHISWNPTGQVAPRSKMNWDDLTEESPTPMKAPSVASTATTTHTIAPVPGTKTIPIPKSAEGEHALVSMFNEARDRGNQGMMQSFAESLKSEYGYEAGPGEGGWWYVKPPSMKARVPLPVRPVRKPHPNDQLAMDVAPTLGGVRSGGGRVASGVPPVPEPRSEPTTLNLGPASIRSPGQGEGIVSHVGAVMDPLTRPLQFLSTAISGIFRKSGADINSTFGGPDSPYTWKQVLDAANESFYTGQVKPGFEVPVKELTKLAMEQAGLDPEGRMNGEDAQTWKDKAAKVALEVVGGIGDPVNIATAEGVAKPLLKVAKNLRRMAGGVEPVAAVPSLPTSQFPEETGPVPLLHRPLEEVYKPSGAADTLLGQRWAGEQARRAQTASENAPPVDESIRPGLRRAREVASEPLHTPGAVKPVEPIPTASETPSIPGGVERRTSTTSIPPVGAVERRIKGPVEKAQAWVARTVYPKGQLDELTGLQGTEAWERAKESANSNPKREIAILDANDLSEFNNKFGHDKGNEYLRHVGQTMIEEGKKVGISERDLFRTNKKGDEFAIIGNKGQVQPMLDQVKVRVAGFEHEGTRGSIAGGVGENHVTADQAMYADKQTMKGGAGVKGAYGAAKVEPVPGVKPTETATAATTSPEVDKLQSQYDRARTEVKRLQAIPNKSADQWKALDFANKQSKGLGYRLSAAKKSTQMTKPTVESVPTTSTEPVMPTTRTPKFNPMTGEALPTSATKPTVEPVPGTIPNEPSIPSGHRRLYRGETTNPNPKGVPEWIQSDSKYKAIKDASGRWFYSTRKEAEDFARDFGYEPNKVSFVDVPEKDFESYRASNQPEVRKHVAQGRSQEEFFVPSDIASKRIPSGDSPKVPGERSLPKTLEESGLEGGTDRQYDVQSHAQTQEFAEARLARGLDSAVEWVKSTDQPSAEHTATGILAIRDLESAGRLKEASDLAGHLSERLTRTGQAADAAKIAQELSPERSLMIAQRIASNSGRKLTEDLSTRLIENTKIARTAETKINDINVKLKSTPLAARLETAANEARQRITAANEAWKARTSEHGAISLGGVQGDPVDYAIVGAQHITAKGTLARPEGLVSLESWSKAMKDEFPQIRDKDLPNLFKESYERVQAEKLAMRESGRVKGLEKDLGKQTVASLSPDQVKSLLKERELLRGEQARARQEMASVFNRLEHGNPYFRAAVDTLSIPRTLMSTGDLSYTARQGMFTAVTEPKIAAESFARQVEAFGSKEGYEAGVDYIESHPFRRQAEQMGIDLLSLKQRRNPLDIANREEYFPSRMIEKVPGVGNVVEAANRGYTMAGDIQRLELGAKWYEEVKATNKRELSPYEMKKLGDFVNTVTGRASLGKLEHAAPILNQFLFAPKLLASRIQLMNPVYLLRQPAGVRRLAMQKTGRFYATVGGTLLALSQIPGVHVAMNPRDPDFGKIKVKNTRIDISGGALVPLRTFMRSAMDIHDIIRADSSHKGKTQRKDAASDLMYQWGKFARGKESPNLSLVHDWLVGEDFTGHQFQAFGQGKSSSEPARNSLADKVFKGEVPSRLWPMTVQDAFDGFEEGGLGAGFASIPLSGLGFGVQTYNSKSDQKQERLDRAKSGTSSTVAPVPSLPPPTP